MSKQTAVIWFLQELETEMQLGKNFNKSEQRIFDEIKQEALQMEKEQIEEAYVQSMQEYMIAPLDFEVYKPEAEEYYQETYGGQDDN